MKRAGFQINNFKNKNSFERGRIPNMAKGGTPVFSKLFLRLRN